MKKDDGFLDYLHELLEPCGAISTRRMFGGHGVYCDGLFIAIVIESRLYLKVDAGTEDRFRAAGSAPFAYESRGKSVELSYWNVPEEAMDSPDDMRPWAKLAIAAALRKPEVAKAARAAKSRRKSPVKPGP
jgi:DNA transformation protein